MKAEKTKPISQPQPASESPESLAGGLEDRRAQAAVQRRIAAAADGHSARVLQRKPGVPINDDDGLEREADAMGAKAQEAGLGAACTPKLRRAPAAQTVNQFRSAVIQRNGDDWALKSTNKIRRELDKTNVGKEFEFRFDHGEEAGFGTTLHHHVSRAKMSEIVTSFKASKRRQSKMSGKGSAKKDYGADLAKFESAVSKIASEAKLDTDDLETMLHNLPLNLHYGPSIVKENPGSGFDPSTRPRPNTDGEREMEPTSAALFAFLNTYDNAVGQLPNDSDGWLPGDTWTTLAQQLNTAHGHYKRDPNVVQTDYGGISVNREQWVKTEGSDTWAKRGLNKWPAFQTAQARFQERTGPLAAGGPALSAHQDFTILDNNNAPVTFRIGYSAADLVHFCNRHTYRHFDTAEIKLLNTFFPAGTNQAGVVLIAQNAFALVEAELRRNLPPAGSQAYDLTGKLTELLAADGLSFKANNLLLTVIDRDDNWGAGVGVVDAAVQLVQLVPTGPNYESYDEALLEALNL